MARRRPTEPKAETGSERPAAEPAPRERGGGEPASAEPPRPVPESTLKPERVQRRPGKPAAGGD